VIATGGVLSELKQEGVRLKTGAGVACARAARFSAAGGLTGAEFLAGIPGTVGGALAMNAGAFGGEMWDIVDSVETMDRRGRRRSRQADAFDVGYRSVGIARDEWFVSAVLVLEKDENQSARRNIRALLARRAETQPVGERTCGSVFRNPPDDHAARLIDACGLKGMTMGGARVSEKHANFIVNTGNATAADIEALILRVQQTVMDRCQVRLEMEVRIVGETE